MNYNINARCKYCDRFIPIEAVSSSNIRVRCNDRRCKQWNDIKVVMLSDLVKGEHENCPNCKHADHNHVDQSALIQEKDIQIEQKTKESQELQSKIDEMKDYIASLEGIVDGQ